MRISAIVILVLIFMSDCTAQKSKETVFKKYDSVGRIVEIWGNEMTWDNNVNFREFYYYDKSGKLIRKLYYDFQDNNVGCLISEDDSLRYTEFKYIYDNGRLHLERRYDPVLDKQNKVIGHELTFVYNWVLEKEDVTSPNYGK